MISMTYAVCNVRSHNELLVLFTEHSYVPYYENNMSHKTKTNISMSHVDMGHIENTIRPIL